MSENPSNGAKPERTLFGTFGGVFTPSILTILGVIMFMRANFVIGNAGVLGAIAILVVAKLITFTTTLSLSAIGTNMQVRGGGAYFLISRVLGPEFGGAIGIALFFALALSVPFYILGFTEALLLSYPGLTPYALYISMATALAILGVAFVGADWAIKTQFFIMAILVVAILAFMLGAAARFETATLMANLQPNYTPVREGGPNYSFWLIFAIYFPAVTGIDAGVNMSGDLKDPAKSLPTGTLAAVGVGFLVYLVQAVLSGGAYSHHELTTDPYGILKDNAIFGAGFLVVAGVFAATLSSALGSCLGAPRVLQAVSRDDVLAFLRPFAKGAPGTDEPRRALYVTTGITFAILIWAGLSGGEGGGALNSVAAVITMFFLYTYGMMNLAAFIEAFGKNPSWRPRFRFFHWSLALLGTFGCVGATFLIDWRASLSAIVLIAGLLLYLRTRGFEGGYADARRGFVFASLRKNLLRLSHMKEDSKNWRPTVLVLSGNPSSREVLVSYGVWIEARRGVVILASVITGDLAANAQHREQAIKRLETFCDERRIEAIPMVAVGPDIGHGVETTLQAAGLGPVQPNLVLFGWATETGRLGNLGRFLRSSSSVGMSCLLLRSGKDAVPAELDGNERELPHRRIDIWWRGRQNGGLMVLLAHLITRNWEFRNSTIRVMRLIPNEKGRVPAQEALQKLVEASRVEAVTETIVSEEPFPKLLRELSGDAHTVMLGFKVPEEEHEQAWFESYARLLNDLPATSLLVASHREGDDNLLMA